MPSYICIGFGLGGGRGQDRLLHSSNVPGLEICLGGKEKLTSSYNVYLFYAMV